MRTNPVTMGSAVGNLESRLRSLAPGWVSLLLLVDSITLLALLSSGVPMPRTLFVAARAFLAF